MINGRDRIGGVKRVAYNKRSVDAEEECNVIYNECKIK